MVEAGSQPARSTAVSWSACLSPRRSGRVRNLYPRTQEEVLDRDLEGGGVLMCQPMGTKCASHDAGLRPAYPGGRVGSLNAACYTLTTGASGPRTQVAAWARIHRQPMRDGGRCHSVFLHRPVIE